MCIFQLCDWTIFCVEMAALKKRVLLDHTHTHAQLFSFCIQRATLQLSRRSTFGTMINIILNQIINYKFVCLFVCYCSMLLADFLRGNCCSKKTFSVLHSAGNVIASSKFVWHNDQNNLKSNHRLQVCLFVCLFVIGHNIFFS